MDREIYAIVGPSGVGKDTVGTALKKNNAKLKSTVSCTTRLPREGETNGVDYYFMTKEEFESYIDENAFVEWCEVHGKFYGTLKSEITYISKQGSTPLLVIDVEGFDKFKAAFPETKGIFINPPSIHVLEKRLRDRGTESDEVIAGRMAQAKIEISRSQRQPYDLYVINEELNDCIIEVGKFIKPDLVHTIIGGEAISMDYISDSFERVNKEAEEWERTATPEMKKAKRDKMTAEYKRLDEEAAERDRKWRLGQARAWEEQKNIVYNM